MAKPVYEEKPIGSLKGLAYSLSLDSQQLMELAEQSDSFYHLNKRIEKDDGSFREIYAIKPPLKKVQRQINKRLINRVSFPKYLQGSIKDRESPRSFVADAAMHINARLLISLDISNFFPSVTADAVCAVWMYFFHFPFEVAQLLTNLTTHKGFLIQGSPTSPGIANLLFWDREYCIYSELEQKGFKYTRYVDDISISTEQQAEMPNLAPIISRVFGMFHSKGVKANRNKIRITTSGYSMSVHNININGTRASLQKRERAKIRTAVHNCKQEAKIARHGRRYRKLWEQTNGRVVFMRMLHHAKANEYIVDLNTIRPLLQQSTLKQIENMVLNLERSPSFISLLLNPQKRYFTVLRRLEILSRVYPQEVRPFRERMKMIESWFLIPENPI